MSSLLRSSPARESQFETSPSSGSKNRAFRAVVSILLSLAFVGTARADEKPKTAVSPTLRRCIFVKPIEIGASITARLGERTPGYATFTRLMYGAAPGSYEGSPSSKFIDHYRDGFKDGIFVGPGVRHGWGAPVNFAIPAT